MLSVLASLVLGLLIATSQDSSDATDRDVRSYAGDIVVLAETLRDYEADAATPLERTLRQLTQKHGIFDGASALGPMLQRLAAVRGLPPSVADLGRTLRALDAVAHGADVSSDAATAALDAGAHLLDALRQLLEDP
jgi:hypothetical protein